MVGKEFFLPKSKVLESNLCPGKPRYFNIFFWKRITWNVVA